MLFCFVCLFFLFFLFFLWSVFFFFFFWGGGCGGGGVVVEVGLWWRGCSFPCTRVVCVVLVY